MTTPSDLQTISPAVYQAANPFVVAPISLSPAPVPAVQPSGAGGLFQGGFPSLPLILAGGAALLGVSLLISGN